MATFTWTGTPETSSDWNTPANWIGGIVPNAADANVIFPIITATVSGEAEAYFVTIAAGETIAAGAVLLAASLTVDGVLNVTGTVTLNANSAISTGGKIIMAGGTLIIGSIDDGYDIQGTGTLQSATFLNTGSLIAAAGNLTLGVTGEGGSFANLAGGTLSGGSYGALSSGTLALAVGGSIVVDAAAITLDGTEAAIYTIGNGVTATLQSSLTTIAEGGVLALSNSASFVTLNTIEVDGTVVLGGKTLSAGSLMTGGLLLGPAGVISGAGTIGGGILGTGTVAASNGLLVTGTTGAASLTILSATLDLTGASSGSVTFEDTDASAVADMAMPSALILGDAAEFTNTIAGFNTLLNSPADSVAVHGLSNVVLSPDRIVLPGVSLSLISGETYSGNAQGGTLTFKAGMNTVTLRFAGQYQLSDFAISAGAQQFSNSPPSVVITDPVIHLTGNAPTINASSDKVGRTIYGTQSNAVLTLGIGGQTVTLLGTNEQVIARSGPSNNVILGPQGTSTVTLGDGYQTIVMFGVGNTTAIGNAGAAPGILGALSYINAGTGQETVTAGNGTNVINTGGYGDTITTGNGLNLIFATDLSSGAMSSAGTAGHVSLSLGNSNNFAYLHGAGNVVTEHGGTDAIWGGTGGGDQFSLAPTGGALFIENFGNADVIDLTWILSGVSLASDLSNIGSFVSVAGYGADDTVFGISDGGSKTVLQITGAGGTAYVNLENAGSLTVAGLISQNALLLPGH